MNVDPIQQLIQALQNNPKTQVYISFFPVGANGDWSDVSFSLPPASLLAALTAQPQPPPVTPPPVGQPLAWPPDIMMPFPQFVVHSSYATVHKGPHYTDGGIGQIAA